jgi:hypothetical protein
MVRDARVRKARIRKKVGRDRRALPTFYSRASARATALADALMS